MYRTADVQYSCMGAYMLVSMVPYLVVNTPSKAGARDSVSERRRDFISRFDFFALIPAHCTLGHLRVWALLRLRATSSEEERAVQRDSSQRDLWCPETPKQLRCTCVVRHALHTWPRVVHVVSNRSLETTYCNINHHLVL